MRRLVVLGMAVAAAMASQKAMAVDVAVTPLKLIIVDKLTATSSAKAVFVIKGADATGITKGNGTDPAAVSSELNVSFDAESGDFVNPSGTNWLVNKPTVAKYVNKGAPVGGATKVSVVKPGKLIKNVAKSLGDEAIDISVAPTGDVAVLYRVDNAGPFPASPAVFRHCGSFDGPTCAHKNIAGGTGWKLVCKGNGSPETCPASPSGAFVD